MYIVFIILMIFAYFLIIIQKLILRFILSPLSDIIGLAAIAE